MSEAFRPHESASIDEGLRVRLEGQIELLEDALPLLDSLRYLVERPENSKDDLATLHECVNQLPRIDEAIDKANKHEQAVSLTQAVGDRKRAAWIAANERLVALGRGEARSLRAAVSSILELVQRQGTPPRAGELQLIESPKPAWGLGLVCGGVLAFVVYLIMEHGLDGGHGLGSSPAGLFVSAMCGAMACILVLYKSASTPWVLLPDRLFFPARWPEVSREIPPSAIQSVTSKDDVVTLALEQEALQLRADDPQALVTKLRLLASVWLAGLNSPPSPFELVDAVDDVSQAKGRALISKEGVLFVPSERRALLVSALTPAKLPKEPTIDELLELIAHLPTERWAALGEHLGKSADAIWLPSDDAEVEDKIVRVGEKRVRLMLSHNPRRYEAEKILKAF